MTRYSRMFAIARGVGAALLKRAIYIAFGVLVLQLVTLQFTQNTGEVRQQKEANQRLEKALKANQEEHKKTQRYLRCVVLLPVDERTEANFAKCGATGVVDPSIDEKTQRAKAPATTPSEPSVSRMSTPTTSAPPEPDMPVVATPEAPQEQSEERPGLISSTVDGLLGLPGRILEAVGL